MEGCVVAVDGQETLVAVEGRLVSAVESRDADGRSGADSCCRETGRAVTDWCVLSRVTECGCLSYRQFLSGALKTTEGSK